MSVAAGPHTFDGRHSIRRIVVVPVYFVPRGRRPLLDWRERVAYFARRLEAFHAREFAGQSILEVRVRPTPLFADQSADELRASGGDQNALFWRTVEAAWKGVGWPRQPGGAFWDAVRRPSLEQNGNNDADVFPILLVLSDINWRELDDFRRERIVNGVPTFEGTVNARTGRHFPGAESGGARAVYLAGPGVGVGLVSADGWRVPYSGSDCVVYHEGVGHAMGLPHPEPMNDSVMGRAQYVGWLNETWLDAAQKQALGVPAARAVRRRPASPDDLFSAFTAVPDPVAPAPGQPVVLRFSWPKNAALNTLRVETQTDLFGPWKSVPVASVRPGEGPPPSVTLGAFAVPTPVSYRVRVTLADGQSTPLWGYFSVTKPKPTKTP